MTQINERRALTYAEFAAEATERFGPDAMRWAFRCPTCGDVATATEHAAAGGKASDAGMHCIGRAAGVTPGRGCNWAAYGLIPGPWAVVYPADGAEPEVTVRAFPLADAPVVA